MTSKEKQGKKEALPTYEVEFIPAERRLRERREDANADFPENRRNFRRRKTDHQPPPEGGTPKDSADK